jgi:Glycosyltransferase family 87
VINLLSRLDRARDGLVADLLLYAVSAAFALVTALTSTLLPHRAWGAVAALGYAAAALAATAQLALRYGGRLLVAGVTWGATALLPLVIQAVQRAGGRTDRAQEEVLVVEHGGQRLLDTGTPYLGHDAIAALPAGERLIGYLPYQPGMALFGVPRAVLGSFWFTDARIWFALVTGVALYLAVRVLADAPVRALQFATVLPLCALTLATGGDDLPVLTLCLLAVACCAAGRFGGAGLAVGAAAALKLFAWPVLAVLLVFALVRRRGRVFLAGALGLPVLALLPPLLVSPDGLVENVIRFPLGHGLVTSPAQSPFPGHLIATWLPGGRVVAAALLALAALAIAVLLVRRPPRTAASAALVCGYGLLAAILLMPSTRFGYLLYPAALLVWAPAVTMAAPARDLARYR